MRLADRRHLILAVGLASILAVAPLAGQERFRKTPPVPDSLRELRLPPIQSATLSNGLTVAIAAKPGSPFVTLQLIIMAGESDSPETRPGVAAVTARAVGRGTRLLSADAVEAAIESFGGSYTVSVAMDYTVLTISCLEESMDEALSLLSQMVLEPTFTDLEVSNAKRTFFYERRDLSRDSEYAGLRHLLRLLFEGHPYHTATYPDSAISAVTGKDIAAFYGRFYRPNNAIFAATGDLSLSAATRKISRAFGSWVSQPVEREMPPAAVPNTKERVCFLDHPSARDAVIFVGNLAMPASSPDTFAFRVLNQVLGGTTGSRLFMDLRETKSYAYRAFSEATFLRWAGAYWAKAVVPRESVFPAVREILNELRVLSTEKPRPEEIEQAKSFVIGNLPLRFETLGDFSARLTEVLGLSLGDLYWNRLSDHIMLVNVEQVLEVAQRYFLPAPIVVIVGSVKWADEALRDFPVVEVYNRNGDFTLTLRKGEER